MKLPFYFKLTTFSVALSLCALVASAQKGFFEAAPQLRLSADENSRIKKLSYYQLKTNDLRTYLAKAPLEFKNQGPGLALQIPLPNGTVETFDMLESPILSPEIAAKHPDIKTYTGTGQTHKTYTIRVSFTALGFNAIILGVDNDAVYFDKVSTSPTDQLYRTYFTRDVEKPNRTKAFGQNMNAKCGTVMTSAVTPINKSTDKGTRVGSSQASSGTVLRTFRLAMAADGEFTQQAAFGGNVNLAYAAIVGYVNRLNAVYRVELSVAFTLVSTVSLVYSNTATDPYTDADQGLTGDENQANMDAIIGNANYDIGHVFGSPSGGGSVSGQVCHDGEKALGTTGPGFGPDPYGDQVFFHEMGHAFGMNHSYNSSVGGCVTRNPATAVEAGAGASIMSYDYICSDSDGHTDNYEDPAQYIFRFHTVSYDESQAFLATVSCGTTTNLNNAVPVVSMPPNRTIPKSTPFTLTGTATDANAGNVLTYSWEGTNRATMVPVFATLDDPAQPPFFRTYEPVSSGTRTFPRLSAILNGSNQGKGDKLPSVGIVTTNRLTVRDGVGGVSYGEMTVTVDGNSGPFLETTNLAGAYLQNTTKTITWSVANTTAAPVNCANVNILLSTDGGLTFPTTLVANTPNDGSQVVTLPAMATDFARIKIASSNNIFFDISNSNFSIVDPANQRPLAVTLTASPTTVPSTSRVSITALAAGGRQTYTYAFEGNLGYTDVQNGNTDELSSLQTGVHTFTATVTDSSLPTSQTATATVSFTVTGGPVPVVSITAPDSVVNENGKKGGRLGAFTGPAPTYRVVRKSANARAAAADDEDFAIFHFARDNADERLEFDYTISGSITADEYRYSNGQDAFAVGELAFDLQIFGVSGLNINGDKTLTFTLVDKPEYDVNPNEDAATVTFMDNDAPRSFVISGVTTINCTPVGNRINLSFNPQYAGLNGQPISFSVVNELTTTIQPGPYSLSLYTDNPVITLSALQSGTTSTFTYGWLAACNSLTVGPGNTPPTVANPIPSQLATVGQGFSYGIPANTFTDAQTPNSLVLAVSGLPAGLNFTAPATISGTPSASGVSTVTVTATDPGSLSVSTTFTITVSPAGSMTNAAPFSITGVTTVSCSTLSVGQRSLTFTPRYAGLTGSPVSFSVANELPATTNAGPYTLSVYTDNPVITLKAVQSGVASSFAYNWLAACSGGNARISTESVATLKATLYPNPVNDEFTVRITGAQGKTVQLLLTDVSGRPLRTKSVAIDTGDQPEKLQFGQQQTGLYLLRVSTGKEVVTLKVIKQ